MEEDTPSQKQPGLDLKEIRQIVDLMAKNDLTYFHLERSSFKLELRRGSDVEAAKDLLSKISLSPSLMAGPAVSVTPPPVAQPVAVTPAPAEAHGQTINSPMVGTFYRSSSPGERPFLNIGDSVDDNTVVCIVEAMKVMNEIKAEARGVVTRILAEDGKPVQYGQPLFELK